MKRFVGIFFASLPFYVQSADFSISKEARPSNVFIMSGSSVGMGTARVSLYSMDFPRGTLYKMKTLKSISWRTTYYPRNSGEKVYLCYMRPYSSKEEKCVRISPNSFGNLKDFNSYRFGNGAGVNVRHEVTGGDKFGSPAGKDVVVFHYYDN